MTRITSSVVAFMLVSTATVSVAGQVAARAAIEKQLIANERAINSAFAKNDVKAFHQYADPQGFGIDMTGIASVAEMDKMMPLLKIASWSIDNERVLWVDANTAVLMYRWTGKGTYGGQPIPSPTWASTVWTNRNGKWTALFHQETMAMAPAAEKKK